jgi:hypothetical protein
MRAIRSAKRKVAIIGVSRAKNRASPSFAGPADAAADRRQVDDRRACALPGGGALRQL